MDRLRVGHSAAAMIAGNVEIALRGRRRPDAYRLVGERDVLGVAVGFGSDDDRLDAELAARALDAQRDLAAIGDQDLVEQLFGLTATWGAALHDHEQRLTNSTACPFSARIALIVPAASASISFISFIASTMQSVSPCATCRRSRRTAWRR
jgi:hypothetical protein